MNPILSALIDQWPALAGLLAVAFVFWKMFEKHLDENRALLSENKKLLEEYRLLSNQKVEEIDRLRKQFMGVLEENQRVSKRYDEMKGELSMLLLENRALKRIIESIEEMMRATGSDVKVISTQLKFRHSQQSVDAFGIHRLLRVSKLQSAQLKQAQRDLQDVSSKLELLEHKRS